MPDITKGKTFSSGDTVTAADLNSLLDDAVINNNAITNSKIADGAVDNLAVSGTAEIDFSKLASLSTGQVLAGNEGTPTATTLSGDVTIAADGAVTVADNAITPAKMEYGTQGDVLVYGASGAPERLGYGTDGQVLTTGGENATPSWTTVETQTIGFTSAQGTPTTNSLNTSTYTHWGTCTLTLPTGKTWLWVKVVTNGRVNSNDSLSESFKITTDSDGTVLLDSEETTAGWVYIDSFVSNHNSDDSTNPTRIAEGVPVGRDGGTDHTSDTTLDLKIYMKGGGGGDQYQYRSLYAVGQYA